MSSCVMTSGCGTIFAGRCSTAERLSEPGADFARVENGVVHQTPVVAVRSSGQPRSRREAGSLHTLWADETDAKRGPYLPGPTCLLLTRLSCRGATRPHRRPDVATEGYPSELQ